MLTPKCRGDFIPQPAPLCFQTRACEPDTPSQPPRLAAAKKKNELTLKWAAPPHVPADNGSKITSYTLEYQIINNPLRNSEETSTGSVTTDSQEANEEATEEEKANAAATNNNNDLSHDEFEVAYQGPLKQCTVKKLRASTCYAFRVCAENALGRSEFSPLAFIYTSGSVPSTPEPPRLTAATTCSLSLAWTACAGGNSDYELQMLDADDKLAAAHGYLTVYNGAAEGFAHTVTELKRCSAYLFRLRARNDEGSSGWSESRRFCTLADVPQPPSRLRVVKVASSYRVSWEPPKDNGGDRVSAYILEIGGVVGADSCFEQIYSGEQLEHCIERSLQPGCSYLLRACCVNAIGPSEYTSEPVALTMPAVTPGQCLPPKLNGKVKI